MCTASNFAPHCQCESLLLFNRRILHSPLFSSYCMACVFLSTSYLLQFTQSVTILLTYVLTLATCHYHYPVRVLLAVEDLHNRGL
jgi:hypothetical protein